MFQHYESLHIIRGFDIILARYDEKASYVLTEDSYFYAEGATGKE